jgi:gluconokinase
VVSALVVVSGVSGCGKTTLGEALAKRLDLPYADADDFHSPGNRAKMHAGIPLSDVDRTPWLDAIGRWLAEHSPGGGVVSCSALRRRYREQLLVWAAGAVFFQLCCPEEVLTQRLGTRKGHFMPLSLLPSQLAALEPLEHDEPGLALDCSRPVERLVEECVSWLPAPA